MAQGLVPFQYEEQPAQTGLTALAGLPILFDLAALTGLVDKIRASGLPPRGQTGWPHEVMVVTLVLLVVAGGESVDDVAILAADDGVQRILRRVLLHQLPREERRRLARRMKKSGETAVPSPSAMFRWLALFHDPAQDECGRRGEAVVPPAHPAREALASISDVLVCAMQMRRPSAKATLDIDATLIETTKCSALRCYKGFKAYQPVQLWWAEQQMMVCSEFRDGNVPAHTDLLRVLENGLQRLPKGVEDVALRSDTAGYRIDLLRYCAEGQNERFGVIRFVIGVDVCASFRAAVAEVPEQQWKPLHRVAADGQRIDTGQQWAEVYWKPDWIAHRAKSPEYRFVATREPLEPTLPGIEPAQAPLPFPTIELQAGQRYKLHGYVTNELERAGDDLIRWGRKRCGESEQAHDVLKNDLAGGTMPSGYFGCNAAWWQINIIAANLLTLLRVLAMPPQWRSRRLKALRFALFAIPGRVYERGRQLFVRLTCGHPSLSLLLEIRARIGLLHDRPPP